MSSVANPDRTQPFSQWEEVDVTFSTTGGGDTIIPHTLAPPDPDHVNYIVLRRNPGVTVYHDASTARKPWGINYIVLRCNTPGAHVTLLLSVSTVQRPLQFIPVSGGDSDLAAETAARIAGDSAETAARIAGDLVTVFGPNSQTGTVNDWAPGIVGNSFFKWNGASDLIVTGFAGGVSGQTVTIRNSGTKVLYLAPANAGSAAANQLANYAQSGMTPLAAQGVATYRYDGTSSVWRLVAHEQGAWVTPTYSGSDYTASTGTWTVDAGDIQVCAYRLSGRTLSFKLTVTTTSVSNASVALVRTLPGGFTAATRTDLALVSRSDNGGARTPGSAVVSASTSTVSFVTTPDISGFWAISVNNTYLAAELPQVEVQ